MSHHQDGYRSPAGTYEPVRKSFLEDFTLSDAAYRLALHLAAKPPGWVINETHLQRSTGWTANKVRTALKALRRRRLIVESYTRRPGGQIKHRESSLARDLIVVPHGTAGQDLDAGNLAPSKPDLSSDLSSDLGGCGETAGENLNGVYLAQAELGASKPTRNKEKTDLYREDGKDLKPHDQLPLIVGVAGPPGEASDDGFKVFWAIYPRKVGKGGAKSCYAKAVKKGTDPRQIIAGAERYRDDPNRDDQFTKHPSTWLNQGCWDDEPLPVRRGNGAPTRHQQNDEAAAAYLAAVDEYESRNQPVREAISS